MRNFRAIFFLSSSIFLVVAVGVFLTLLFTPNLFNSPKPHITFVDNHPDIAISLNKKRLQTILSEYFMSSLISKQIETLAISVSTTYPTSTYSWRSENGEETVYAGYTFSVESDVLIFDIYLDTSLLVNEYGWDENALANTGETMLYELLMRIDPTISQDQLDVAALQTHFNQIRTTHPKRPFTVKLE